MSEKNMKRATLENIEKAQKNYNWRIRVAAIQACKGKDIPTEIIERWAKDNDWHIRYAAMRACEWMGSSKPIVRTIEPPALVYKKCIAGVIVVAEIPKDAQVRGRYGHKCRSDRAIIREIIGEFYGENVGISRFDKTTAYHTGDEVKIDDFDMSDRECSTGFHFFCTQEDAEAYQ